MTFLVRDEANALVEIGADFMRDPANVLVEIGEEWIRDASGLHQVFGSNSGPFTVEVIPPESFGARMSSTAGGVFTSEVTATPTGGKAPFTFLWQRTDANPEGWSIVSPTSQTTQFRALVVGPGAQLDAAFACTVTDANGNAVTSYEVSATAANYGTSPL